MLFATFTGRLTKDVEIKTPQAGGNQYASFSVATDTSSKDRDGKYKTLFINVAAFGKSGETIAQYFHKGSRITVSGEISDVSAWVGNNDNQPHASINFKLSGFDFIDSKAESQATAPPPATQYAAPASQPYQAPLQYQQPAQPAAQSQFQPPAQSGFAPQPAPGYPPQQQQQQPSYNPGQPPRRPWNG